MFDSDAEVVDLSNPICEGIPTYPKFPSVRCEATDWAARDGFTMEHLEMRTHTATHVDSPIHFIPEGKTLDDYPVSKFMGPGVALDLTPKEPEEAITVEDLERFDGEIDAVDVVMLYTGWDDYHGNTSEYAFEFPYLTGEAAQWLADRDLDAVGTDGASVGGWVGKVPAHGPATDVGADESHVPLLENDIIPIEELRNLDQVLQGEDTRRADFFYPPLRLQGTSGSSARAFAFL
jgi:kynurenine formamidase